MVANAAGVGKRARTGEVARTAIGSSMRARSEDRFWQFRSSNIQAWRGSAEAAPAAPEVGEPS
jgi:hypothetical protein